MNFIFNHYNYNVLDLQKSMEFYETALGLKEIRRKEAEDGSYILVYLGDGKTDFSLELTWLRDRKEPYQLGENEFHLAFVTENFEQAYQKHKKMGCICFENPQMGIYFINDPDNYWLEIVPAKNKPNLLDLVKISHKSDSYFSLSKSIHSPSGWFFLCWHTPAFLVCA